MTGLTSRLRRIALTMAILAAGVSGLIGPEKTGPERTVTPGERSAATPSSAEATRLPSLPPEISPSDWTGIRLARETWEYRFRPESRGVVADNPAQQLVTAFDGRGFLVRPRDSRWSWGLELAGYGRGERPPAIGDTVATGENVGARLTYRRDERIDEWYVNDQRGLEHGFTVHERPVAESDEEKLRLRLRVRGDLQPEVIAGARAVTFRKPGGGATLNYTGLKVWDADGRELGAWFEPGGDAEIGITVDERGARYPLTIDPTVQQAYLKASNNGSNDLFGSAVAISGDTVVVGAPSESSNATGVNGNAADNSSGSSGAAYVFVRSSGSWSLEAYLKASNTGSYDEFGGSVAISGETIVVGAKYEDSNATGVNGSGSNNSKSDSGAAYVFVRSSGVWSQQAYLKASNTDASDNFGGNVAISGDTVVVAASNESSNATGVNGNQSNNSLITAGAAYVFVRSGGAWSQQAYLKASNTNTSDAFGRGIAIDTDTIVVGASGEASNATGVNGNESNNSAFSAGAAYVFVRSGGAWSQEAYLKASNSGANDLFGYSVGVSGDTIVVGAVNEDSNATTVNGDQTNNSASNAGAAYVFFRSGGAWSQQAYLKAANASSSNSFGTSVAISGDTIVVGSSLEDGSSPGVDGAYNNSRTDSGASYVFMRSSGSWNQNNYVKPGTTANALGIADLFGIAVAIDNGTMISGAPFEDSNATTIDGDAENNSSSNSGAAFVHTITVSAAPAITAASGVTVGQGATGSGVTIATVTDADTAVGSLTVTVTSTNPSSGVTISGITNTAGTITATIAASGSATSTTFTLQVRDSGRTATDTLSVTVLQAPAITAASGVSRVAGASSSNSTIATVSDPDTAAGSLTVTVTTANPANGVTVSNIVNTGGTITADVVAASVATTTSFTLQVSDGTGTATATLNIAVTGGSSAIDVDTVITTSDEQSSVGPGSVVTVNQTLQNSSSSTISITYTGTLPAGLSLVPGSCTASGGSCTIGPLIASNYSLNNIRRKTSAAALSSLTFTWTGTIPAAGSVTISFQIRVSAGASTGAQYLITSTINGSPGPTITVTISATPTGPGDSAALVFGQLAGQKPGSVLIYNLYSSGSDPSRNDSRITITNTNPTSRSYVHLFFVDGSNCSVADMMVTLTQSQTMSFLASEIDPGVTGYLIAVATDTNGCPVIQNDLIGESLVKLESGHRVVLPALGVTALGLGNQLCSPDSTSTTLSFDGLSYNPLPRTLAISGLPSITNGYSSMLVVNRIGGDLRAGAERLGSLFGLLYDDQEASQSFTMVGNTCQLRGILGNNFPRTSPRYSAVIPAGRSGWMKFSSVDDQAITGVVIQQAQDNFAGGHNLHHLTTTNSATLTIPVIPNQ